MSTLHDKNAGPEARETRTDYDVFGRPTRIWGPDDGLTLSGKAQTFFWYQGIFTTIREIQHVAAPDDPQPFRTNLF